jgi:peptidoglycan/xylan/chitin deacetylase (PgdA/CDA1 family)
LNNLLLSILGQIPSPALASLIGKECLLPYYHLVSDEAVPHVAPLFGYRDIAGFKKDLELLCSRHRPISLEEFLATVSERGQPPEKAFLLTFDDGFREMHDVVAPILHAKGIPAVFFVISETLDNRALCFQQKIALLCHHSHFTSPAALSAARDLLKGQGFAGADLIVRLKSVPWAKRQVLDSLAAFFGLDFAAYAQQQKPYLTNEQISSLLSRGFSIGGHSVSHPRYSDLSLTDQLQQTKGCMELLAAQFSLKHRVFAFPHTDRGVHREFFDILFQEKVVEATFGTTGPYCDSILFSFQRDSFEKPNLPAKSLYARHALRRSIHRLGGRRPIQRD